VGSESDDPAVRPYVQIVQEPDGRFHWQLINPHGTPAVRSMGTFLTEDEAVTNAEYARHLISEAPVKRASH
jgi:hypothetical protein